MLPLEGQASLFSSIFGTASASTEAANSLVNKDNSQTMALLEPNAFSISSLQGSQDKKSKDSAPETDSSAEVNILSDNALVPSTSPLGDADEPEVNDPSFNQTSVYVVRKGDSLSQIADMYGVSVNTILWANDMKKGDKLTEGDVLVILPISGLEHSVAKGETLQSIAKKYKADVNDIVLYNDLSADTKLAIGDKLIIPNAEKSAEGSTPIKNLGASIAKDNQYYAAHPTKNLSGYYINPVPGARKSQGIHDHNAVDLAIGSGTPIHAAASGTVLLARTGYNGGFGNLVIINHPNGTQTLYAHQSRIATHTGEQVSQGEES